MRCGRRYSLSDDAVCTSLAQFRVEDREVDQCQATRESDGHFWDVLGGATPSQQRSSKCGAITIPHRAWHFPIRRSNHRSHGVTTFEEANSLRDLARASHHEAAK